MLEAAILCLALNIYHEARSEPFKGQYAVAAVTMNRAGDDPKKVCKVVYERDQFSWTRSKKRKPTGEAWVDAKIIAQLSINDAYPDPTNGATHFHEKRVRPGWRHKLKRVVTIGRHIFYRQA